MDSGIVELPWALSSIIFPEITLNKYKIKFLNIKNIYF